MYKQRKCKDCKEWFQPFKFAQPRCYTCALVKGKADAIKRAEHEKKRIEAYKKKAHLKAKEKLLTVKELKPKAQRVFNEFIRLRDKDLRCISCDADDVYLYNSGLTQLWDAGHYLSRGARPWLAFNELNVHKQCKICNGGFIGHNVKTETVTAQYRVNLIKKIGLGKVEELENTHDPKIKLTPDDYRAIIAMYRNKIRQLKKESQTPITHGRDGVSVTTLREAL